MLFIFGHSALLILEIINPIIGIFHGSMLMIGVATGYLGLFLIGKVSSRVAWKIYKINNSDKILIEFIPYSFVNIFLNIFYINIKSKFILF